MGVDLGGLDRLFGLRLLLTGHERILIRGCLFITSFFVLRGGSYFLVTGDGLFELLTVREIVNLLQGLSIDGILLVTSVRSLVHSGQQSFLVFDGFAYLVCS